jgi:hypothetical protein
MPVRKLMLAALAFFVAAGYALAADITGKWTASFDSQVGQQNYTYEFQVKGSEITGTAKSANGETKITDGKVDGDTVKFVENLDFQGMPLRIEYSARSTNRGINRPASSPAAARRATWTVSAFGSRTTCWSST